MKTSDSVSEIIKALIAAQKEIQHPSKNKVNPHFKNKYADLLAVIEAAAPVLNKHGILLSQTTRVYNNNAPYDVLLYTTLMHESGQYIESEYPVIPEKQNPQGWGIALTYAKRYALSSILGMAADEDTDGEYQATERNNNNNNIKPFVKNFPAPTEEERAQIIDYAKKGDKLNCKKLIAKYNLGGSDKTVVECSKYFADKKPNEGY